MGKLAGSKKDRAGRAPRAGESPARTVAVLAAVAVATIAALFGGTVAGRAARGPGGDATAPGSEAGGASPAGADSASEPSPGSAFSRRDRFGLRIDDLEGRERGGEAGPADMAAGAGAGERAAVGAEAAAKAASLADAAARKGAAGGDADVAARRSTGDAKGDGKKAEKRDGEKAKGAEEEEEELKAGIAGRIIDLEGDPVEGAVVRLRSGRKVYKEGKSGPDGRYRLDEVPAGRYRLSARAKGFLDANHAQAVEVAPGEQRDGVDVALKPGGIIAGHVVDQQERPVKGARVSIRRGGAFGNVTVRSAADGSFAVAGATVGRNVLLVEDDRFLPASPVRVDVPALPEGGGPGAAEGVVVRLVAGAVVTGETLALEGGGPVPSVVSLQDARGRRLRDMKADRGRFHFPGLKPGEYQLVATPADSKKVRASAATAVAVEAGETRRADLYLDPGGALAGTVMTLDGRPVERSVVTAAAQGVTFTARATTDGEGRFAIPSLVDGHYTVSVAPPERFARPDPLVVTVAGGEGPQDLVFVVDTGAVVAGQVLLPSGAPAGGASVAIHDALGNRHGALDCDPSGRYRLPRLPAGLDLELFARAEGNVRKIPLRLDEGEERAQVVLLEPGARVRGVVLDAAGAPLGNANVEIRAENGVGNRAVKTRGNGTFELVDIYPGSYVLRASKKDAGRVDLPVTISPSQVVEGVELRLR